VSSELKNTRLNIDPLNLDITGINPVYLVGSISDYKQIHKDASSNVGCVVPLGKEIFMRTPRGYNLYGQIQ
jgi:hypothetical protein